MSNVILVAILLVAVVFGIKEIIKHARGGGDCCGGSSPSPKKKKLEGQILRKYIIRINGMHCQNCANVVTEAINSIDGVSARVSYKKKTAKVYCNREINVSEIEDAIRKRGYGAFRIGI